MNELAEFGQFLREHREKRGMSREELSRLTRISPGVIVALEEGNRAQLPDQVFVQNHVKSYAKALGCPENELLDRLLSVPGFLLPTAMSPARMEVSRRQSAWKGLAVTLLAVALAGLALWWWQSAGSPLPSPP